jgi:hypothetical protein
VAITSFVGRRRETTALRAAPAWSRIVTLTGVGGVGKSRLGVRVGEESWRTFADGIRLVDIAPVGDAAGSAGGPSGRPVDRQPGRCRSDAAFTIRVYGAARLAEPYTLRQLRGRVR